MVTLKWLSVYPSRITESWFFLSELSGFSRTFYRLTGLAADQINVAVALEREENGGYLAVITVF